MPAGTLAWIARRERCRLRRREPEDLPFTWWYEIIGELPIGSTPACNMGLEGMVSKRADRPYRAGRSNDWLKVKNRKHPAYRRVQEQF